MAVAFVGSFALNTSTGSQTVSPGSLGFTPVAAIFWMARNTADGSVAGANSMLGVATSSSNEFATAMHDLNAWTNAISNIVHRTDSSIIGLVSGTDDWKADFTSFNASPAGFTINISDAPPGAYVCHYILFGDDVTAAQAGVLAPTSTGNKSVTGLSGGGAAPSVVFFFTSAFNATADQFNSVNGSVSASLGWMCADGTQGWAGSRHTDNVDPSDTARCQMTTKCYTEFSTSAKRTEFSFVSMDTNGFTYNVDTLSFTDGRRVFYLALFGGEFTATSFNSSTGTGNTAVSTTGLDPSFALLQTIGATTSTSIQTEGKRGIGAASGASERACIAYHGEDNQGTSDTSSYMEQDRLLASITAGGASPTVNDLYDLVSFDSEGFTYNHVTASGTAIEIIALVGGTEAAAGGEVALSGSAATAGQTAPTVGIEVGL